VILATGTEPLELGIPVPRDRLFYEVTEVPARFKRIAVIGGGDAAFDYALNLKAKGKSPVIICRAASPKCLWLLFERAMEASIPVLLGIRVLKITGKSGKASKAGMVGTADIVVKSGMAGKAGKVTGGTVKGSLSLHLSTSVTPLEVDCILAAIGRKPALGILEKGLAAKVARGIKVPGLYIAGDVHADQYRQVAIAAGDGLKAAMAVTEALS